MATTTIDLFFATSAGFEGHMQIAPGDGERAFDLLRQAEKALISAGCGPRPAPSRGSGGRPGGGRPAPVVVGTCPRCGQPAHEKSGTSRRTGKPFKLHECAVSCGWQEWQTA